jgi:hypothetical protein
MPHARCRCALAIGAGPQEGNRKERAPRAALKGFSGAGEASLVAWKAREGLTCRATDRVASQNLLDFDCLKLPKDRKFSCR